MRELQSVNEPVLNQLKREIGRFEGTGKGPNVIFFGGIHGNEWAGVQALKTVSEQLEKITGPFKGNFYALAGNLKALEMRQRFIAYDLNRIWFPKCMIPPGKRSEVPEYKEKIELLKSILDILKNGKPTILIDLHTTSSQSIPFISISDTLKNRRFTKNIPVPLILGLEELLDGPMFSFFSEQGLPTILFEGGQHEAPSTLQNHIAFIWLMLNRLGILKKKQIPGYYRYVEILKKNSLDQHKVFELKYRYLIGEGEQFRMKEGFVNFEQVRKGKVLAKNQYGKIRAPLSGRIFLPLYQSQGTDGFFIVREIRRIWLRISKRTRQWRIETFLPVLPGVQRKTGEDNTYVIDKSIARWRVLSLFHLLGYRKVTNAGHFITVKRRPYDRKFPPTRVVVENIRKYLEEIS